MRTLLKSWVLLAAMTLSQTLMAAPNPPSGTHSSGAAHRVAPHAAAPHHSVPSQHLPHINPVHVPSAIPGAPHSASASGNMPHMPATPHHHTAGAAAASSTNAGYRTHAYGHHVTYRYPRYARAYWTIPYWSGFYRSTPWRSGYGYGTNYFNSIYYGVSPYFQNGIYGFGNMVPYQVPVLMNYGLYVTGNPLFDYLNDSVMNQAPIDDGSSDVSPLTQNDATTDLPS